MTQDETIYDAAQQRQVSGEQASFYEAKSAYWEQECKKLKAQLVEATASADRCCENYRERDKEYWNINERFKEEVRNGNELEARNAKLEWRIDRLIEAIAKLGGR